MTKAVIAGGGLAIVAIVVLLALVARNRALKTLEQEEEPPAVTSPATALSTAEAAAEAYPGFLFGRVTTDDGTVYEGRLRFGGDEEAYWGDHFDGSKQENPWVAHVPADQLSERRPIEIFGIEVFRMDHEVNLDRPFMARFGDITRIESKGGRDLRVTLKSGTLFRLDGYAADDFADGVRVWDAKRGVVDLDEGQIRTIELLPTSRPGTAPDRLHGAVRTRGGVFTGFIQWNRETGVGSDELYGQTADGKVRLPFNTVRSIARRSNDSSLVTLLDGREIVLSDSQDEGADRGYGMYVDDQRYGRVLISWDVFERGDFSPGGISPAYGDFPTGRPLTGDVTTRAGRRLAGRLVYDLDESENTETLDAPSQGVTYNIPFGLIASIELPESREAKRAKVTLHSGELLPLDLDGDLGGRNAGMLIFAGDSRKKPEYVRWNEIKQIHFDRPPAMYPPLERR